MILFLVYPLANLIALIVASVPELTILTFSTDGIMLAIFSAISVSISVGVPNVVPFLDTLFIEEIVSL